MGASLLSHHPRVRLSGVYGQAIGKMAISPHRPSLLRCRYLAGVDGPIAHMSDLVLDVP